MQIYLARNNEQAGPYSLEQINQMLASGQVVLTDLAWHEGMDNWQPLQQLTGGKSFYDPHQQAVMPTPFQSNPVVTQTPTIGHRNTIALQQVPIASIGKRLLGAALDQVITLLALVPIFQHIDISTLSEQTDMAQMESMLANVPMDALITGMTLLLAITVVQAILIIKRGQSLGKLAVGTRIVDQHSRVRPGAMNTFVLRSLITGFVYNLPVVGVFVFFLDLGMMIFSAKRMSLHDQMAQTVVVDAHNDQLPT